MSEVTSGPLATPRPPRMSLRSCGLRTLSMSLEPDQRAHRHVELAQLVGAAEIGKIDDETGGEHLRAELAQQLDRALRGAAGGDQVVHQDDAVALLHRILVHLHLVEAVLERIGDRDPLVRQLALLADRHESGGHLMRHRAAQNKAARLDAGDLVDLHARPRLHQLVDGAAEGARIAEQRGDVAEDDAGLGIVGDAADRVPEIVLELDTDHEALIYKGPIAPLWRTVGRCATDTDRWPER